MREIKFRALDTRVNKYLDLDNVLISLETNPVQILQTQYWDTDFSDITEHLILEQYTGLKDKNGVEIYEGDILENLFRGEKQTLVCEWHDYGFDFNDKRGISRFLTDATVIGNIHEGGKK